MVAVLTAADLPIVGSGKGRLYEPLAREEVVYAGQPVALVVAESEALAEDGVELVEVELEPLEPVLDLEAATLPGAPRARVRSREPRARDPTSATPTRRSPPAGIGDEEDLSDNVLGTAQLANGDVDAALAASHVGRRGAASPRPGCIRAISSPRPRSHGSSPTANSSSAPRPRLRSPPATRWPSCSASGRADPDP